MVLAWCGDMARDVKNNGQIWEVRWKGPQGDLGMGTEGNNESRKPLESGVLIKWTWCHVAFWEIPMEICVLRDSGNWFWTCKVGDSYEIFKQRCS